LPPHADVVLLYNHPMRLAWFTPLAPVRSGIAAYSADLLPLLAGEHAIDVFIDRRAPAPIVALPCPVLPAHQFVWRHARERYDLVVYQLGNATCHDYMWPFLVRFPGLVVLHDGQLHQARAKALLTRGQPDEYRAEFAFSHAATVPEVADFITTGLGGSLYFLWPMLRVPVESSRLVVVHSPWLAAQLAEQFPASAVEAVAMGVPDPGDGQPDAARVRERHGIAADEVVLAAYGGLTPEKRLPTVLGALRSVLPYAPHTRLLLVGQPAAYYDVEADARAAGVWDRVTITGFVSDAELPAYLHAADVCLCLRWPTSRETSASWLRCLAAGKPTVTTDLAPMGDVPALDPRTWAPLQTTDRGEPIGVAIDILDELHSLGLALRRLARDADLRVALGARARRYWERHHTPARMAADYGRVIEAAVARPARVCDALPSHLRQDGTATTTRILGEFGLTTGALEWESATSEAG
jgi:glycosyltransferase involved in cell wall biosynthesis